MTCFAFAYREEIQSVRVLLNTWKSQLFLVKRGFVHR